MLYIVYTTTNAPFFANAKDEKEARELVKNQGYDCDGCAVEEIYIKEGTAVLVEHIL